MRKSEKVIEALGNFDEDKRAEVEELINKILEARRGGQLSLRSACYALFDLGLKVESVIKLLDASPKTVGPRYAEWKKMGEQSEGSEGTTGGAEGGKEEEELTDVEKVINKHLRERKALEKIAKISSMPNLTPSVTPEQPKSTPPELTDICNKLEKEAESLLSARKKLEELCKSMSLEPQINESDVIEKLKKQGYKIEPPPDWSTVDKLIDEKIRKVREEAKREAMEELKLQEKRESMLVDFISTVGGAIIDGLRSKGESKLVNEALKERVSEWKEKKSEQKKEQ